MFNHKTLNTVLHFWTLQSNGYVHSLQDASSPPVSSSKHEIFPFIFFGTFLGSGFGIRIQITDPLESGSVQGKINKMKRQFVYRTSTVCHFSSVLYNSLFKYTFWIYVRRLFFWKWIWVYTNFSESAEKLFALFYYIFHLLHQIRNVFWQGTPFYY